MGWPARERGQPPNEARDELDELDELEDHAQAPVLVWRERVATVERRRHKRHEEQCLDDDRRRHRASGDGGQLDSDGKREDRDAHTPRCEPPRGGHDEPRGCRPDAQKEEPGIGLRPDDRFQEGPGDATEKGRFRRDPRDKASGPRLPDPPPIGQVTALRAPHYSGRIWSDHLTRARGLSVRTTTTWEARADRHRADPPQ